MLTFTYMARSRRICPQKDHAPEISGHFPMFANIVKIWIRPFLKRWTATHPVKPMERAGPQLKQCLELRYQTWRTSRLSLIQMFHVLGRQTACMHVWMNVCISTCNVIIVLVCLHIVSCNTKCNHLTWRKHGQRSKNWPRPIGNRVHNDNWARFDMIAADILKHKSAHSTFLETHNNQTASQQMSKKQKQLLPPNIRKTCGQIL